MCLWALVPQAQKKCAVLTFQSGEGVTLSEADAITLSFRSYFRPTGYTSLAGNPVDNAARELKLYNNRNKLTLQQMRQLGSKLGADCIIVGTLSNFRDGYSVDVRIVEVAKGVVMYKETKTFRKEANKTAMEQVAKSIASKLPKTSGNSSSGNNSSSNSNNTPIHINPHPDQNSSNSNSNNTSGNTNTQTTGNWVDLGLSSGTKWAKENFGKGYFIFDNDIKNSSTVPTPGQWRELRDKCKWTWNGSGFTITGPNGNSITLPALGYTTCSGRVDEKGVTCYYWTNEAGSAITGKALAFIANNSKGATGPLWREKCNGYSVRLVKSKGK